MVASQEQSALLVLLISLRETGCQLLISFLCRLHKISPVRDSGETLKPLNYC